MIFKSCSVCYIYFALVLLTHVYSHTFMHLDIRLVYILVCNSTMSTSTNKEQTSYSLKKTRLKAYMGVRRRLECCKWNLCVSKLCCNKQNVPHWFSRLKLGQHEDVLWRLPGKYKNLLMCSQHMNAIHVFFSLFYYFPSFSSPVNTGWPFWKI